MSAALTIKDCDPSAVIQGFKNQERHWQVAHWAKVRQCRDAAKGDQQWSLGDKFDQKGTNRIRLRIPQTLALPLKMISLMEKKRPGIRRFAASPSPRHQLIASNVETWSESTAQVDVGGRPLVDWSDLVGKLLLEGACAVIAAPSLAMWEKSPDFLDTIDRKKYAKLAPSKKARYSEQEDGSYARMGSDGEPLPKKRYWRDARGRSPDDDYYEDHPDEKFVRDDEKTEEAYASVLSSVLARRPPFSVRVVSSTDSMPVYGPGNRLIGIFVRSRYTREALLRRRYYWTGADEDSDGLVKRGDEDLTHGDVTLYEYWGHDTDGSPFVSYAVEGVDGNPCETYFRDPDDDEDLKPAVINLAEEHGLSRLPATWVWGLNLATDDYPNKAVPFLWPTISALTMVEAFLSAKAAHTLQHGFTSWFIEADAEILKIMPDILLEGNKPRRYDVDPMTMVVGPGKPHALVPPQTSPDVNDIIHSLMQMAGVMSPADSVFGGGGATSGHDRSLAKDYVETAMSQVLEGARRAYEFVVECLLEIACAIEERYDVKVPIYARARVAQARLLGRGTHPDQAPRVIELDPDWLDEIYDVEAYYPFDPFENIALINLYSQLYKDGLISWEEWRAILGDEHPEMSRILLWINQQINTEDGKRLIAAMAQDIMGGDLEDEIKRLVADGLLTPDGEPVDSLVDEDEMRALEYFANRQQARQLIAGAGPMGPGVPPLSPNAPASVGGLVTMGQVAPPTPEGTYTPPGQVQAPPPQGAPGQTRNIGTGVPNIPNSALGGVVAGQTELASLQRDELGRQQIH